MTLAEQYEAATGGAAMFDVSDRALIEVTGSDRAAFLHNFCTNDVKKLRPGEGCEAFVTSEKGRILGHVLLFAEEESLWIDSDPGTESSLLEHFNRYVITEDVEFADRTSSDFRYFVCGSQTPAVLLDAFATAVAETAMCGRASMNAEQTILRAPLAPNGGWLISTPQDGSTIAATMQASGAAPADRDVLEVLRIEAVWPRYGVDITDANIAQEAGRTAQAISFTKGCYLGQEPIARLDALGHTNRELRGIRLETPGEVAAGATVLDAAGAADVGKITSVAVHPVTNCPVALAMLKTAANAPQTPVLVETADGERINGVVFGAPTST